ncbi:MAG: UvrD-helicase domain-containing protein [Pseudomonadota bacterium]
MPDVRIVPAGAGAGKTHHIKQTLLAWVKDGSVRPERILAVTFTEAGAGELRQRIRASLIAEGRMAGALAVDRAYVSTIHGLGLRLLTEHAFAAGASPAPRLLSDEERDLLIRNELPHASDMHEVTADLPRYGYRFGHGTTPEGDFRSRVFETVALLSTLGPRGLDPALPDLAEAAICATYGTVRGEAKALAERLHAAVEALFAAFPESLSRPDQNNAARETFRENHRALCAARDAARLERDWELWTRLADLRLSRRGTPTPDGYDDLAGTVMEAASVISTHPGPLEDACRHAKVLIRGAQQILKGYAARKRELGVIDFTDMVANAGRLLREEPQICAAVLGEVDCVIVDEFQDTNPAQFALLWPLIQGAPRAIIVGDVKQAIMGFQGADVRLMEALVDTFASGVSPLDRNWRSSPRIMAFVNAVGDRLFPGRYDPLSPTQPHGAGSAIEVAVTHAARRGRATVRPQQHLAAHLHAFLERPNEKIRDRHTGDVRRPTAGDVAVLCPTNSQCIAYAGALARLGVPVRVAGTGWWTSPIVQAARFALQVADDPLDRHAALCLATLGPPGLSLQEALGRVLETGSLNHPILDRLRGLSVSAPGRTVRALLGDAIAAAGLRDWADLQDDPAQARADLLRLEAEAEGFLATHRDMRAAAGFHGFGVKVFLGWMASRLDERGFDQRPNPTGDAADGVEVLTWHASKGREWPVVAVAGLDHAFEPRGGGWRAVCEDYADLDGMLTRTHLTFSPTFHAADVNARFQAAGAPEAESTARRLLYVALTRPRDVLVLEWPQGAVDKAGADEKPSFSGAALLASCGMTVEAGRIMLGETAFSARTAFCGKEMPPEYEKEEAPRAAWLPRLGRRAVAIRPLRSDGGPALLVPSGLQTPLSALPRGLMTEPLGSVISTQPEAFASATDRGTALHDMLRIFLLRPDMAECAGARFGLDVSTLATLAAQAGALKGWLAARGYDAIMTEVPIEAQLETGARISATLDLVARGSAGLALIDHKSDALADYDARFAHHWPQLSAYMAALRTSGFAEEPMLAGIYWLGRGAITFGAA